MYLDNDILPLTVSECFCRLYLLIIIWRVRLSVEIIWTFDPNASVSDILAGVSPILRSHPSEPRPDMTLCKVHHFPGYRPDPPSPARGGGASSISTFKT